MTVRHLATRSFRPWFSLWLLSLSVTGISAADWSFDVRFSEEVYNQPYSGRVYLVFSRLKREPRNALKDWFKPEQFVVIDVENFQAGQSLTFTTESPGQMLAYPVPPMKLDLAGCRVQAVIRFNPLERDVATGAGNGYSDVIDVDLSGTDRQVLVVDKLNPPRRFNETNWSRVLEVRSNLLSDFHNREVTMKAAIVLPASYYEQPQRRYPTIFIIPGFGGTYFGGQVKGPVREQNAGGVEFVRVLLDPNCPLGHHVFADSANNGPVSRALVEEFIPGFERSYRSVAEPSARFLSGHSSGGWSSLWLQVTRPDFFGGTWSTSPDPVDFRDFQGINIYRSGESAYVDPQGNKRPIARRGPTIALWYQGFAHMEFVVGDGGQLHSFEAAFSPRDENGKPKLLWNRRTGAIEAEVARAWKKYDIHLILEQNWPTLGPKLAGKLHVFMGEQDTFYLDGATKLLKQSLEQLESDAVVEIHAGKDHGTLRTPILRNRIRREMVETFLQSHPDYAAK